MGINRVKKRGKTRIELRKRWPDGTTYRRYFPNVTKARATLTRIEAAILDGGWPELKITLQQRLQPLDEYCPTVREFSDIYLQEYCSIYNRRPDFKVQALSVINRVLGDVFVKDLTTDHADHFVSVRVKQVAPATVNRGLAVLKNMLTFAVKKGVIDKNPLLGFGKLPVDEVPLRILTLAEERTLLDAVTGVNPVVGAYTAVLGETGLRMSEGLRLQWNHVDLGQRRLTVAQSKTGHPRFIPLSGYALERLMALTRHLGTPYVFVQSSGKPWKDPRGPFKEGCKVAGLDWVRGFHDLRHFRATMWLQHGVDVHTVQRYLGHTRIETTMRYLHFVEDYAEKAVRAAQNAERKQWEKLSQRGRQMGDTQAGPGGTRSVPKLLNH